MSNRRGAGRSRTTGLLAAVAAFGVLMGCSTGDPDPDPPAAKDPTSTAGADDATNQVRATLGALDPCALLTPSRGDAVPAPYAEGPHTCEGDLAGARLRVEVGVPFDDTRRKAATAQTIAGLTAYADPEQCRLVFGVGKTHGVAVEIDGRCGVLARAGRMVGAALTSDVDDLMRPSGPDGLSACGLLTGAVDDPAALRDAAGDMSQGLDHCQVTTDPPSARTGLRLSYTGVTFAELARRLGGKRVLVNGQDAVLVRGETACYVHTYLWPTRAAGRGPVQAEAVVTASACATARSVAAEVDTAADRDPADAGSVTDLLNRPM